MVYGTVKAHVLYNCFIANTYKRTAAAMEITLSTYSGKQTINIIKIQGNIDSSNYQVFQSEANEVIQNGATHILVDLSAVAFMSSAGLKVLHNIYNQLRTKDKNGPSEEEIRQAMNEGKYKSPHLKLVNPSNETRITLETGGFDVYLEIHDDLNTALASYKQ
jgi:anti-anti-sigma factor